MAGSPIGSRLSTVDDLSTTTQGSCLTVFVLVVHPSSHIPVSRSCLLFGQHFERILSNHQSTSITFHFGVDTKQKNKQTDRQTNSITATTMRLLSTRQSMTLQNLTVFVVLTTTTMGFIIPSLPTTLSSGVSLTRETTSLCLAVELPDMESMKATEMKKELESYGVSTKSMFEKAEFAEALKKAREEGKKSNEERNESTTTTTNTAANTAGKEPVNGEEDAHEAASKESREERYQKAMDIAKTMKVGELKNELNDRGISTTTFLEKTDFVKAYANAVADNIPKGGSSSASSSSSSSKTKTSTKKPEEPIDPSYRDVVTQKFDRKRLMGQSVIDISIR